MAADVHDSVAQSLTFVKMRLALLEDALAAGDVERAGRYCRELRTVATQAHAGLRSLISQLRDEVQAQDLGAALHTRIEQLRATSDVDIRWRNACPTLVLEPSRAAEVYAVVQEAASNVIRHANARHADITLRESAPGVIEALVEDDGTGLVESDGSAEHGGQGGHYGLEIMRERAQRLQGRLEIGPREGGGTCVRLVFPAVANAEHTA
jgi:two-component system nitrate/nitrite sensor histidine kinase NarX